MHNNNNNIERIMLLRNNMGITYSYVAINVRVTFWEGLLYHYYLSLLHANFGWQRLCAGKNILIKLIKLISYILHG